jgi:Protein of unknown function (DUF2794)
MMEFSEDGEPIVLAGRADNVVQLNSAKRKKQTEVVAFNRGELDEILQIYGFKVADGEWRDYAIDMLRDRAVFSVFRKSTEYPLFRIEKNPKLARRQGAYSVIGAAGHLVKRGPDLATVLRVFERRPRLVSM